MRLDKYLKVSRLIKRRTVANEACDNEHVTVNGRPVNIPSYLVKPGMVVALKEASRSLEKFKANIEANSSRQAPKWLDHDAASCVAKVVAVPAREDIDLPIEEQLIVELYSK